jgi:hypothetical protein
MNRDRALGCALALVAALSILAVPAAPASAQSAQSDETQSASDLAKELQNPVANLISVPFQNNTNFAYGQFKKTQNVLNIQPVIPIHVTPEWDIITRTILPIIAQPRLAPNAVPDFGDTHFGLGNTTLSLFLSPEDPGRDRRRAAGQSVAAGLR